MGVPVLVLGASGSGKSTSLRNFEPDEVRVFNVAGKPFPFRKKLPVINNATYADIKKNLENQNAKTYVIDDSQYLMAFESFDHAKETGYGKFTNMALNFRNMIKFIVEYTPADCIVYLLHHTELSEDGRTKAKTLGKMLDNQLTLEGLFSIVLMAQVEGEEHYFVTQSDGSNPCKSPMDMFEPRIDNDLKIVDTTIREYWGLNDISNKESEDNKNA